MCLFCASKPFGFTAASLTRRSFVSHSLALGSASAAVRAVVPVAALARPALNPHHTAELSHRPLNDREPEAVAAERLVLVQPGELAE